MIDRWQKITSLAVLLWIPFAASADEFGPTDEDQAAALVAIQLSGEAGDALRGEFSGQGMSDNEADALAFRVIKVAAYCSVREMQGHPMPQIASFLDLLIRSDTMKRVTGAMNRQFDQQELDEMQVEVARIVQGCLDGAKAVVLR